MAGKYQDGFDQFINAWKSSNIKYSQIATYVKRHLSLTSPNPNLCITQSKTVKTDAGLSAQINTEARSLEAQAGTRFKEVRPIINKFLDEIETLGKTYQEDVDQSKSTMSAPKPHRNSLVQPLVTSANNKVEQKISESVAIKRMDSERSDLQERLDAVQQELAQEKSFSKELLLKNQTIQTQLQQATSELSQMNIAKRLLELTNSEASQKQKQAEQLHQSANSEKQFLQEQITSLKNILQQYETEIATLRQANTTASKQSITVSELSSKQSQQEQEIARLKTINTQLQEQVDTIPQLESALQHQKNLVAAYEQAKRKQELDRASRISTVPPTPAQHSLVPPSVPATPLIKNAAPLTTLQQQAFATFSTQTPAMFNQQRRATVPQSTLKQPVTPSSTSHPGTQTRHLIIKDKIKNSIGQDKFNLVDNLFTHAEIWIRKNTKETEDVAKAIAKQFEILIAHLMAYKHLPNKTIYEMPAVKTAFNTIKNESTLPLATKTFLTNTTQKMQPETQSLDTKPLTQQELSELTTLVETDRSQTDYRPYLAIRGMRREEFNAYLIQLTKTRLEQKEETSAPSSGSYTSLTS